MNVLYECAVFMQYNTGPRLFTLTENFGKKRKKNNMAVTPGIVCVSC